MQTNGPISKAYFRFLTDIVCDNYHRVNYAKLLKDLFAREFIWSVEKDVNRSMDGIDLREDFSASQNHYPYDIIDESFKGQPCSVLEMMVAMASRKRDDKGRYMDGGEGNRGKRGAICVFCRGDD